MGFVGEVAALLVIALLALTGNALVAATLIRRSLLHHPSNRLVLSLTASNLLVVLAVVPGVIASMVMSGTATTVPVPDLRGYTDSGTIESSVLPRALQEPFDLAEDNQLISSGSLKTLKSLKSLKDSKPFDLLKEPKESEAVKTLRPSDPVKDSKPFELLEILRDSQPLEPLEDSKPLGPLEDSGPLEPLKEVSPPPPVDPSKSISPLDVGSHMIHVNETKSKGKGIKDEEGRGDDVGGNVPRKEAEAKEEESPTVEGRRKEILGEDADFYCRAAAFVTNLVSAASSLTVAIIALDRYLAIVRPMMYGTLLTGARCLLLLGCCWGHALLVALGPLLGWSRYERQEGEGWCRVTWAGHGGYAGVWVCTVVLLPLAVMAACYYFILQVARNKCRRIHVGTMLRAVPPPSPSITSTTDNTTITANSTVAATTVVDGSVSSANASEGGGGGGGSVGGGSSNGGGGGVGPVYTIGTPSSIPVTPASTSSLTPGHLPGAVDYLYVPPSSGGTGSLGPSAANGSVGNGAPASGANAVSALGRGGVANGAALCQGLTALLDQQTLTRSPLSRSASCVEKLSVLGGGMGVGGGSVGGLSRASKRYASFRGVSRTMSDGARSLSLHQNPTLTPRSCLKRSQSSVLPRPSFRHKLGLASRKPSWNWESSPAKGFRTVCVVVGAQLVTWLPFTALAVIEAIAGPRHPHILPYWTRACAVLLLYGSSVFYPIVYGLYNRTIRKELRACLFPLTSSKALRAAPRRLSGRHSNSGSLLDFSPTHRIRRGSSERNTRPTGLHVSKSAPTNVLPSLTPTLEVDLPLGVAPGLRKPSQDSGAIMVSYDDSDTDTEGSSNAGQGYRYLLRRGSAPCRLQSDPLGGAPGGSEFSYLLLQEEPSLPESSSQMVVAELHSQSYMDSPQESRRCGDASFYRRDSVATSLFGRRKTILSSLAESTKSLSQRTLTRSGSLDRLFDHVQRKDAPEEVCVTYKASDRSLYQALSFKRPPTGSSSKINIVAGLDRRASKRENLNFYRRDRPYVSIPKDSGILEEPKEEEEEEERGEEEEERGEELQRGDSGGSGGSGERVGMGKVNKEWVVGYKVESEGHGSINRVTSTDSMGSTGSRSTSHVTFFTGTNPPIASYHSKTQRQVSLDEGIGADCILEDLECE
ncbi:uncharacterized protein LOC143027151 isoform X2 [Oratosquilla oratoria]|uniref:uncharacterized protein LOC143027151 isoform X2 n=1 Tax=Oratosquilla oratoria TaxID=337810 RepID=UPI003F764C96